MSLELAVAKSKAKVVDRFMSSAKGKVTLLSDSEETIGADDYDGSYIATIALDDNSYHEHWIFLENELAKICARVHQDVKSDASIDGVLDTLFEVVVSHTYRIGWCSKKKKCSMQLGFQIDVAHVPAKRFAEMAWKCL